MLEVRYLRRHIRLLVIVTEYAKKARETFALLFCLRSQIGRGRTELWTDWGHTVQLRENHSTIHVRE